MLFPSWLRNREDCAPAPYRPRLEALEDRSLPSFAAPISYPAASQPYAVLTANFNGDATRAVADVNGDGVLDLVVGGVSTTNTGLVSVSLGNGDGTFQSPRYVAAGGSDVVALAVGDFNADGKLDLAVAGYHESPENDAFRADFTMLLGRGDGNFDVLYDYGGPFVIYSSFAAGDFNGDGKLDLASTTQGNGVVGVQLGNGDGTFHGASSFVTDYSSYSSVAVADLNGDGKADLVTANSNGSMSVLLGNGDGTFQSTRNYSSVDITNGVAAADFNGDGKFDLVTAGWRYSNGVQSGVICVFLGNGDGTFRPAQYFAAGSSFYSVAVRDFNSDGRPDVAVQDHSNVLVFLNTGDWHSFQVTGLPSSATAGQVQTFTVTALDNNFNPLPSYTVKVHFTSTDAQAVLPADYTFTAADHGTHTFTVTLKTAGTQTISISDTTAGSTVVESGITVKAAAASRLIIPAPSTVNSGAAFYLSVTVKDAYGNVVTDYAGTINFRSSDTTATLPSSYTFAAADRGQHSFSGFILRNTGSQTITIMDPLLGLSDSVIVKVIGGGNKK
jgi:hypothetical protein